MCGRMDNLPVPNIHSHMVNPGPVSIKNQVPWLHLAGADCRPLGSLATGRTVHGNAGAILHNIFHKPGTVSPGMGVIPTGTVGVPYKLEGVGH